MEKHLSCRQRYVDLRRRSKTQIMSKTNTLCKRTCVNFANVVCVRRQGSRGRDFISTRCQHDSTLKKVVWKWGDMEMSKGKSWSKEGKMGFVSCAWWSLRTTQMAWGPRTNPSSTYFSTTTLWVLKMAHAVHTIVWGPHNRAVHVDFRICRIEP